MQQEWVDRNFLASSHVGTPDPRQAHPPQGQRILTRWDFPRSLFEKQLTLVLTVRFWDNTQEVLSRPLDRRRDFIAFYFPAAEKERRILTYRLQVLSAEGEVIETWKHQFWTELIDIDLSNAQRRIDSVSFQPKHASVIETP